jgi:hypothetical protein
MVEKSEGRKKEVFPGVKVDVTKCLYWNPCPFNKANKQVSGSLDYCMLEAAN